MNDRPTPSAAPGPPRGRGAMPTSVRVAIGVLAGLAVLLLLSTLITALALDVVVDALTEAQPGTARSDARQVVLINLTQSAVFGVLLGIAAVFLARGRSWARWTGLAACLLLGLITAGATVLTGGLSVSSQLIMVLCVAAVASLLTRTTAAWLSAAPRSRSAG